MKLSHPRFASEDPKTSRDIEKCLAMIAYALERGGIRNTVFVDCKFVLGRAYEKEESVLSQELYRRLKACEPYKNDRFFGNKVLDLIPFELSNVGAIRKRASSLHKIADGNEFLSAIASDAEDFLERWEPVALALKQLRNVVVKGREPRSPESLKTPPRTLDHTGTCACCQVNVKLSAEFRIVHHGFEVAHGQRIGRCFGVDFPPEEISPEGIEAYACILEDSLRSKTKFLSELKAGNCDIFDMISRKTFRPDDVNYRRVLDNKIRNVEYDIDLLNSSIRSTKRRIETWEARTLPDGRDEHMNAHSTSP